MGKKKAIDLTIRDLLQIGKEEGCDKHNIWVSVNANSNKTIYVCDSRHQISFRYNDLVEVSTKNRG